MPVSTVSSVAKRPSEYGAFESLIRLYVIPVGLGLVAVSENEVFIEFRIATSGGRSKPPIEVCVLASYRIALRSEPIYILNDTTMTAASCRLILLVSSGNPISTI